MSSTATTQSTETTSLPDPLDVVASFGEKLFGAKELKKKLGLKGKKLMTCISDLLVSRALKSVGNAHSIDNDGKVDHRGPTRFRANLIPEGGKFWVRLLSHLGAPAIVPGAGQVTSFGSLVEVTGSQRQLLESRDCPVEVITDSESIAQLVKTETEMAEAKTKTADKHRSMLEEFAV